jgi:hypothetical protein
MRVGRELRAARLVEERDRRVEHTRQIVGVRVGGDLEELARVGRELVEDLLAGRGDLTRGLVAQRDGDRVRAARAHDHASVDACVGATAATAAAAARRAAATARDAASAAAEPAARTSVNRHLRAAAHEGHRANRHCQKLRAHVFGVFFRYAASRPAAAGGRIHRPATAVTPSIQTVSGKVAPLSAAARRVTLRQQRTGDEHHRGDQRHHPPGDQRHAR